jgi:hypothetical protein
MNGEHDNLITHLAKVDGIGKAPHDKAPHSAIHERQSSWILSDPLHRYTDGFCKGLTETLLAAGVPPLRFQQVLEGFR